MATGLLWGGNINVPVNVSPSPRLMWNAAVSGTTPFATYPATYIMRVYPRSGQPFNASSFWTGLFHADNVVTFSSTIAYYGFHPYPDTVTNNKFMWEISFDASDDFTTPVVFDRWYTQVFLCNDDGTNTHLDYYWDYPLIANVQSDVGVHKAEPSNPCIVMGDAPWDIGNEVYNGIIRGLQFYDARLTLAQVDQEIAAPGSFRTPWYLNMNPTPDDVRDQSGGNHHPAWVTTERPALWTDRNIIKTVAFKPQVAAGGGGPVFDSDYLIYQVVQP